jgi:hypothetical protein
VVSSEELPLISNLKKSGVPATAVISPDAIVVVP